jgi:nitroreductase
MDAHQAADVLDRLLRSRRSCRAFLPQPVPQALIERILATAQRTASWCNTQPWQLVITRGEATERLRRALGQAARETGPSVNDGADVAFPSSYQGVYLERRREAAFQLYGAVGVERGDRDAGAAQALRNFDLFDAPHVAIVTTPREQGTYGAMDCAAWVANFMLAAHSLGVACIAQAALARQSALLRSHFMLPDTRQVLCGVSFGYADRDHPANSYMTSRAALESFVTWAD